MDPIVWIDEHNVRLKTLTVEDVFRGAEKNGFEHLREVWLSYKDADGSTARYPTGGCILGQAALNNEIVGDLGDVLLSELINLMGTDLYTDVESSLRPYSLIGQLDRFEISVDSRWKIPDRSDGRLLGTVIMFWNDEMNEYADEYVLPTYADVVNMAREVMTPFFSETLRVMEYDYHDYPDDWADDNSY
jgi:hypothetical protein